MAINELVPSEFDLHIWKRPGAAGGPDMYTIGVWEGKQIRSLCHIAPVESALSILREVLESAGHGRVLAPSIS